MIQHMLQAVNVGCVRGRRLFSNLSFSLDPGDLLLLKGPNGSGKTSLLRILSRLAAPEEGEIFWRGTNIRLLDEEYSEAIWYLGHRNGIKEELTLAENLRISCGTSGVNLNRNEVREILARIGLADLDHLLARYLSEGQKRRLGLARFCAQNSGNQRMLWLLDEVMTSLDAAAVALVSSMIESHLRAGGMVVMATHQDLEVSTNRVQQLELTT